MGSFDIALLEALVSAGVSPERARTVVEMFDRCVDDRYALHAQMLATKGDLAELETRLVKEIARLDVEMRERFAGVEARFGGIEARFAQIEAQADARFAQIDVRFAQVDARFARLETSIAETKADLTKWMLAALSAQTLLLVALKLL